MQDTVILGIRGIIGLIRFGMLENIIIIMVQATGKAVYPETGIHEED